MMAVQHLAHGALIARERGIPDEQIAAALGAPPDRLIAAARRGGRLRPQGIVRVAGPPAATHPVSPRMIERRVAIAAAVREGLTVSAIAVGLGVSQNAVYYAAASAGIALPNRRAAQARTREAQVKRFLAAGLGANEIARRLKITPGAVGRIARRLALPGRTNRRSRAERNAQIADLAARGLDVAEIAARIGVSVSTVRLAAARAGISLNRRLPEARAREAKIVRLIAAGLTAAQIAERLGCSKDRVWAIARKARSADEGG